MSALDATYKAYTVELGPLLDERLAVLILGLLFYGYCIHKTKEAFLPHIMLISGFALLAITSNRMFLDYNIVYCPCMAYILGKIEKDKYLDTTNDKVNNIVWYSCIGAGTIGFMLVAQLVIKPLWNLTYETLTEPVDYILETDSREDIRIFNTSNDLGSYALMNGIHPYMDCRCEVYDARINGKYDVFQEYMDTLQSIEDKASAQTAFEFYQNKYGFDYYVISKLEDSENYVFYTCLLDVLEENGDKCLETDGFIVYKIM